MSDENYFYYYMKGENLPEKDMENNQTDNLTKFKFRIHWYFDAELSTDKMLCEYLCDEDGNENQTFYEVDQMINDCFDRGENISNTAVECFVYVNL